VINRDGMDRFRSLFCMCVLLSQHGCVRQPHVGAFKCAGVVLRSPQHRFKTSKVRATAKGDGPLQRLERIVANRGVGTRTEVQKLFKAGRVSVGGKVVRSGADKYPVTVAVQIDGVDVTGVPLLAVYFKPLGVHSTMRDNWNRQSLEELALEYPFLKTMHPVGRLDADTTGLLLFSSDGQLTQTLLHPSTGVEREYEAVVVGRVDADALGKQLAAGVKTTEGTFAANLLESAWLDDMVRVAPTAAGDDGQEGDDHDDDEEEEDDEAWDVNQRRVVRADGEDADAEGVLMPTSKVRLAVTEGKYRMVRRILHNAGNSVLELHRVRYGSVLLQDLEEGEVRPCSEAEKDWALQLLNSTGKPKSSNSTSNNARQ